MLEGQNIVCVEGDLSLHVSRYSTLEILFLLECKNIEHPLGLPVVHLFSIQANTL